MSVYHVGSRALQDLAGVRDRADHVGRSLGRDIKPVAAVFLELQPLLIVGAADPDTGRVWAAPLAGTPGFVRATGPRQMSVRTGAAGGPPPAGPLAAALATPGTPVGTLALDPRTRRRMRLNGRLRPTPGASPSRPTRSSPTARGTSSAGSPASTSTTVHRAAPSTRPGRPPDRSGSSSPPTPSSSPPCTAPAPTSATAEATQAS